MEGQEQTQAPAMPPRVVDPSGKPFIQAEELTRRLAATIDACAVDHAIGYAGVFGALEQLKAQYLARVALKVSIEEPGDVLAAHDAAGKLAAANQARAAAADLAAAQGAAKSAAKKTGKARALKSVK
ncbi:MAG TPA: hypothetical protein VF534_01300 [Paraburkholderia sp.]